MANMRRTATWKNVGADVSRCRTIEEVLKTSGLDYTVVKRQAYDRFGGRYRKLKGQYFTERKAGSLGEGRWYGPVGENYVVVQLNELAEKYAAMKINPRQFLMLLDAMFPMNAGMTEAAVSRIQEKRQVFIDAYDEEDNHAFRGTAWGLINAYTDCLTRKPLLGTATEETRFVNVTIKNDKSRNVFNTTPSGFLTMVNDIAVA